MESELATTISQAISLGIITAFLASLWLWCRLLVRRLPALRARFSGVRRPGPPTDSEVIVDPTTENPYQPPVASGSSPSDDLVTAGTPPAAGVAASPLVAARPRCIPFWSPSFAILMLGLIIVFASLLGYALPADQQRSASGADGQTQVEPGDVPSEIADSGELADANAPPKPGSQPESAEPEPAAEMSVQALVQGGAASVLAALMLILILGGVLVASPNGSTLLSQLGFVLSGRDLKLGLIATLAILPPTMLLMGLVSMLQEYSHPVLERLNAQPDLDVFAALFVVTALITPVFEEFWFRVILQGGFQRLADEGQPSAASDRWTPTAWWPLWITSVIFALMHMGQGLAPIPLFFLSLGLGYLYRQTGSIWPPVIVHMVLNSLTMLVTFVTMFTPTA